MRRVVPLDPKPRFRSHEPIGLLAPHVTCIWLFECDGFTHGAERIVPDGTLQLLVNLGDNRLDYRVETQSCATELEGAAFDGLFERPVVIGTAQQQLIVGANIRAGSVGVMLGIPAKEFALQGVNLSDALPNMRSLRCRLQEARLAGDNVLAVFERELSLLVRDSDPPCRMATLAIAGLERGASVRRIASELEISQKRLRTLFDRHVGLRPKAYSRVRRFQRVLSDWHPRADWADFALRFGYADQAHFVRDFRFFTGQTPTSFAPLSDGDRNHIPLL